MTLATNQATVVTAETKVATGRAIRATGFLSLATLAAITAVVSYQHGLDVTRLAGTEGFTAYLVPLVPDLTVASSSLAILDAAQRGQRGTPLAWLGVLFGIVTTLAMNLASGWHHGTMGLLVSALAPLALVLSYETLMGMVRATSRAVAGFVPPVQEDSAEGCPHRLTADVDDTVRLTYEHIRDCLGQEPSQRQLSATFGVSRPRVTKVVKALDQSGPIEEEAA